MIATLLLIAAVNTTTPDSSMPSALQPRNAEVRAEVQQNLNEMRAIHEQKREEIREKVQTAQQNWEQAREQFRERLQLISSERKQEVAQNLQSRIETNHQKWVEHWSIVLDRLSQILDKAEARDDAQEASTLIASARAQIAVAQDLLEAQSDNVYVIEIESEENLGQNVSSALSDMRLDMTSVLDSLTLAKEAVREVLNALD